MKHAAMLLALLSGTKASALPDGFVYVEDEIPGIVVELRYATDNNFVGARVDGYLANRAILTQQAATALKAVQAELNEFGLGLKVFDAYRPQKAVDHFVRWGKDIQDTKTKERYYPDIDKRDLFNGVYIAERSGHSRGSTVDLTLIVLATKTQLDMGGHFDLFGKRSWVKYQEITPRQRANRALLQTIMQKHGFKGYSREWWHFTLQDEPFKDEYFDFDVK